MSACVNNNDDGGVQCDQMLEQKESEFFATVTQKVATKDFTSKITFSK